MIGARAAQSGLLFNQVTRLHAVANLVITDGDPEPKGVIARSQPHFPSQRCLFHALRDLYRSLYRDAAQREWAFWEERLWRELRKPSVKRITGVGHLVAELNLSGLHSTAAYPDFLKNLFPRNLP